MSELIGDEFGKHSSQIFIDQWDVNNDRSDFIRARKYQVIEGEKLPEILHVDLKRDIAGGEKVMTGVTYPMVSVTQLCARTLPNILHI